METGPTEHTVKIQALFRNKGKLGNSEEAIMAQQKKQQHVLG